MTLNTLIAFLIGAVVGWISYRLVLVKGMKLIGRDVTSRTLMLDKLGYSSLLKLRDTTDAEIAKRKGPA